MPQNLMNVDAEVSELSCKANTIHTTRGHYYLAIAIYHKTGFAGSFWFLVFKASISVYADKTTFWVYVLS